MIIGLEVPPEATIVEVAPAVRAAPSFEIIVAPAPETETSARVFDAFTVALIVTVFAGPARPLPVVAGVTAAPSPRV